MAGSYTQDDQLERNIIWTDEIKDSYVEVCFIGWASSLCNGFLDSEVAPWLSNYQLLIISEL